MTHVLNLVPARRSGRLLRGVSLMMWAGLALAAEPGGDAWKLPAESVVLKPGKGRELVLGQCLVCHSLDYVTTQPALPRATWQATVEKMRVRYGASIPTNAVPGLVDYLVAAYGPVEPAK
jgi:mono/diheme cytochrome c family protein